VKAQAAPPRRSLKARALQLLAQREHSRAELRRKLLVHARADMLPGFVADANANATDVGAPLLALAPVDPLTRVDTVLDWLEAHNYLSQERFVESRVHARAARFGNLRIRQELAQHALTLSPQAAQALKDSEFDRAHAVWARKYAAAPEGLAEHARQARFLASRGFSADVIRQLLRGAGRARASPAEVEFPED
jgi:regulatory protein